MKTYQHTLPTNWMLRAQCRDAPAELFFQPPGAALANQATIREFCARCPVTTECLAFALSARAEDQYGIWGATSATRRRALLREATGGRPGRPPRR